MRWFNLLFKFYFYQSVSCSLCPTLCTLMDCSPPGSSVHRILQVRILEWVAISLSRGSSPPRDWTRVSWIAGRFFTIWATKESLKKKKKEKSKHYPYQRTLQDFKIGTVLRVKGAMVTKLCQTIKDKSRRPQANPDTRLVPSHPDSRSSEVTAFNSIKHFSHVYFSISK